ncbi:MAG: hypothetical protein K5754_04345 [Butyrivibrio sp.]|nr:hypothetical protein [Butyrivibrio sp.]
MKKKYLILAFALCVVLSGCGEKSEISSKGESMNVSADTASDEGASVHNDDTGTASDNNSQEDTKQEESNKDNNQSDTQIESTASAGDTASSGTTAITQDMAYQGVDNYCHQEYDWSIAEDNPDIMYVYLGEETDTEYLVIFRSYTGSFVYFYVNKSTGLTRMVDVVPLMDLEEESGTINIYDYL